MAQENAGIRSFWHIYGAKLAFTVIVVFAAALRLYQLDFQGLWVDEITSMNGSDPDTTWSQVVRYSVTDQPPAFFLLLHAWLKIVPFNDFYGRLLSVLLGIAGVVVMHFLGKEVGGRRTGLIASWITSISFLHILISREVRFYPLVFLFATLSCLFFIRAALSGKIKDFIFYSVFTVGLLYSHYFGLVVFGSQGIIFILILILYPFDRAFVVKAIASAILITVSIIPWIPIFFSDAQTENFWIQAEPFYFPVTYFYIYFKDILSCLAFGILALVFVVRFARKTKTEGKPEKVPLILLAWIGLSFLIPIVYSLIQTPLLHVRYSIIALPAIIVVIATAFSFQKTRLQLFLAAALTCTSVFSLVIIEQYYTEAKNEDWRSMVRHVVDTAGPDDLYVSRKAWYCNYYFKSFGSFKGAVLPHQLDLTTQKPPAIWWLEGFDPDDRQSVLEAKLLREGYILKKTDSVFHARSRYYELN